MRESNVVIKIGNIWKCEVRRLVFKILLKFECWCRIKCEAWRVAFGMLFDIRMLGAELNVKFEGRPLESF